MAKMEKKSSTSSKLRNIKEFLSSTRSLNSQSLNQINQTSPSSSNVPVDSNKKTNRAKNSISLFNLMSSSPSNYTNYDNGLPRERPVSMALEPYGYGGDSVCDGSVKMVPNKSLSMYGLATENTTNSNDQTNSSTSRNPAIRLFYTIRSKFLKKRRERSKIVDSKSTDFGSFLTGNPKTPTVQSEISGEGTSISTSTRYQLKSSKSVDNVLDNVASLFGYRNNDSQVHSEVDPVIIVHPHLIASADSITKFEQKDAIYKSEQKATISSSVTAHPKMQKCLTKELGDLLHYGWYWGGLSKNEAEEKLKGEPNGAFVVRDSSSDHYLLSLSFNSNGRTLHTRIEYRNGQFCFYSSEADSFPSVAELIEHSIAYSEGGIFCYSKARRSDCPSYPVRLTKPISRFTEVKSLLYLSRFVIRQYVRLDLIPLLPLPPSLIGFIAEQRYI